MSNRAVGKREIVVGQDSPDSCTIIQSLENRGQQSAFSVESLMFN